jgi:hypothetical protein
MRFYFHVLDSSMIFEDSEGVECPTLLAAFEEGGQIARELLDDPDTTVLRDGVINIVGSNGDVFIALPISVGHKVYLLN